jgi:hypothetical protein
MFARPEVNANFYGQACSPLQCLSGEVDPPFAANCLYEALYDSVDYLVERQLLRPEGGTGAGLAGGEQPSAQVASDEPAILGRGIESSKKTSKRRSLSHFSSHISRERK